MFMYYRKIIETNITAVKELQIYWNVINQSGTTGYINNIVVLNIMC